MIPRTYSQAIVMNRKHDIGQEILDGIRTIKAGKGKRRIVKLPDDVRVIRERMDPRNPPLPPYWASAYKLYRTGNKFAASRHRPNCIFNILFDPIFLKPAFSQQPYNRVDKTQWTRTFLIFFYHA